MLSSARRATRLPLLLSVCPRASLLGGQEGPCTGAQAAPRALGSWDSSTGGPHGARRGRWLWVTPAGAGAARGLGLLSPSAPHRHGALRPPEWLQARARGCCRAPILNETHRHPGHRGSATWILKWLLLYRHFLPACAWAPSDCW